MIKLPPRASHVIYLLLILLRLLIALTSTSTIHPDEHFQNPEIAATLFFPYDEQGDGPLRTWEWEEERACRSIMPVGASIGIAFGVMRLVGRLGWGEISGRALFIVQRLWMFGLSLCIDRLLYLISGGSSLVLILCATSPLVFTFLLRPFSNSLESALLSIAFLSFHKIVDERKTGGISPLWSAMLGGVIAFGIFTRVSFVPFITPIVGAVILQAMQGARIKKLGIMRTASHTIQQGLPAIFAFLFITSILTLIDYIYFTSQLPFLPTSPPFFLTPLNSLLYNVKASNLESHGLHPRWLHIVVNAPMLFGVGLICVGTLARRIWRDNTSSDGNNDYETKVHVLCFTIPLLLLSILPHQEPRFLLPLIIPVVLLTAKSPIFRPTSSRTRSLRKIFWIFWTTHSILFTILFGYLHQGGLVPALLRLNEELVRADSRFLPPDAKDRSEAIVELIFWRTFMPARHLLIPTIKPDNPIYRITDLAGSSSSTLLSTLTMPSSSSYPPSIKLLITPAYAFDQLTFPSKGCAKQVFEETFGIHIDMDELDALIGIRWSRVGVGIWDVSNCSV